MILTESINAFSSQLPNESAGSTLARDIEQVASIPVHRCCLLAPYVQEQSRVVDSASPIVLGDRERTPDLQPRPGVEINRGHTVRSHSCTLLNSVDFGDRVRQPLSLGSNRSSFNRKNRNNRSYPPGRTNSDQLAVTVSRD
jgi:hypothetical protein